MKLIKTHGYRSEQLLEIWENKDVKEVKAKKIIKSLNWDKHHADLKKKLETQIPNKKDENILNNKSRENKVILPKTESKPNLTAVVSKIDTGQSRISKNKNSEKFPASGNKDVESIENSKTQELKLDFIRKTSKDELKNNLSNNQTSLEYYLNNEIQNTSNKPETISLVRQNTNGEKKSFFPNTVRQIYPMVHQSENEEAAKHQAPPLSRGNSKFDLNERPKSSTLQNNDGQYLKQETYPKFPQPGTIFTFQNLEINKKLSAYNIPNTLTDRSSPDGDDSSEKYNEEKF
jgi:hypothetical protein